MGKSSIITFLTIGILVLVGFGHNDTVNELEWIAKKILNLRIFSDNSGKSRLTKPVFTFCCKRLLAFMLKGVPLKVFEKETSAGRCF